MSPPLFVTALILDQSYFHVILQFVFALLTVIVNPYSWELTFCGIDFNGSKLSSNTYFIPPTSLWELSFPPLRFAIPSFVIIVSDGPTPSIYPLSYSSYKVFDYGVKTRGSY
jgi:hypothetical protein